MGPRTILYTGKGGVGKTSVAAASALRCAASGLRTIVMSTDPAHSLADSLGTTLGDQPAEIQELLWAQQVSAQEQLEHNWSGVQDWLGELLSARGVNRISAEELSVPPGLDELFSLLTLKQHHQSGAFDVIVVDCAPTGETLRLLAFPEVARWWLERVLPAQNQLLAAARPFARAVLDVNLPSEQALDDVQRLSHNLIALHDILGDHERVTIRLVMNPDRMVIDEARRTFTYLNLYGYLTDAIVVNRIFPEEVGEYFNSWRTVQQQHLEDVRAAFSPVPVLCAPYFDREVQGKPMLQTLGEVLFKEHAVTDVLHRRLAHEFSFTGEQATLRVDLPFADRQAISLKKIGLELIIKVDDHRRTIMLPTALTDHEPSGARLEHGSLHVDFQRDRSPKSS